MTEHPADRYNVTIGDTSGQVVVGSGNTVHRTEVSQQTAPLTPAELAVLRAEFVRVRGLLPEDDQAALERLDELEEAVTAPEPDLSTMEYVRRWFGKHLPALAGSITGLIVHPIVGRLVEAAGDTMAAEFRRRFEEYG